jgi:PAS domain S-box-containing protein
MAETVLVMEEDERLEQISAQIVRLANADFKEPGIISEKDDFLDSIVVGLNVLGEELESYVHQIKESEEKVQNALNLLKEAQRISHIGSWEWVIKDNTVNWTDELYRIYGRERENFEASFENFMACIHPADREYVNAVIGKAYQEKEAFSFAHRIVKPDGSEAFLDCKGNVYTAEDGSLLRMTGTAQDVTELKKAEQRIMQLASIVEYSSDAIISKTTEGYVTSWNRQAEVLFGYSEKEMLGKHISLLFPEGHVDEEDMILAQIKGDHALLNYETERVRKDGTRIMISSTISPIKDPSGKIIGVSKIARDITEKKAAEAKLMAYTAALEQKNRETEQFAYIASHDLQEPLRTITNYIGLFDKGYKGKLDEKADIYIGFINSASKRMQVLITDLLEYTRIENDKSQSEVDCNVLLSEILKDMQVVIEETGADIKAETLPVVTGQYSRLKSLFQNLISNAIKFRKPGEPPQIGITVKDHGKEWLFEIKDNGIGIEKAYYEKIFKIFQRLHSRKDYQGTGIGLAHCKKIVDLRGGQIWVESEFGKGSSFFFTLPKNSII